MNLGGPNARDRINYRVSRLLPVNWHGRKLPPKAGPWHAGEWPIQVRQNAAHGQLDRWGQLPLHVYPPAVRDFAGADSMQNISMKEAPHGVVTVAKKDRIILIVQN